MEPFQDSPYLLLENWSLPIDSVIVTTPVGIVAILLLVLLPVLVVEVNWSRIIRRKMNKRREVMQKLAN